MLRSFKFQLLLSVCAILLSFNKVSATNSIWGAEMKYNWYNTDTLRLTITVYTECNTGFGWPSTTIAVRPDCASKTSVTGTFVKGLDITPVCKKSCTKCNNTPCKFAYGIVRSTITALIPLKGYGCCNYTFSWTECCTAASNITAASNQIYLESSINTCYIKNNVSPVFQDPPIFLLTKNECVDRMQSVSSNAGDSIVYSLVAPMIGTGTAVTYAGKFSETEPLTYDGFGGPGTPYSFSSCRGFHYNSQTGELQFKPTRNDSAEISYKAEQWHKDSFGTYRKVGTVIRTATTDVMDTLNTPPTITDGYQGTGKRTLALCSGKAFSLTLSSSDADKDSISIDWGSGISGASFKNASGTSLTSTFSWTPKASDIRKAPYTLTVTLRDNHCPLPSVRQENFLFYVIPGLPDSVKINKLDSGCGKYYISASADTSKHFNYKWFVNGLVKSNTKTFSLQTAKNGTYQIELILSNGGCINAIYDSVICKALPNVNAGTTLNICPNTKGTLNGSGQGILAWLGGKSISSLTDMHATVSPDSSTFYVLKATNAGCSSYDTVHANVSQLYMKVPASQRICGKSSIFQQKLTVVGPLNTHYQWSPDTVLASKEDNNTVTVKIKNPVTFTITATDALGCSVQGKVFINVDRLSVSAGSTQNICYGDSIQLNPTIIGNGVTHLWKKAPGLTNVSSLSPYVKPTTSQWYHITASDTFGCNGEDSVQVNVSPRTTYMLSTRLLGICKGAQGSVSITGNGILSYNWAPSNEISVNGATAVFTPTTSRTYYVTMKNIYGCYIKDSVRVYVDNDCVYPGDANHDKTVNYLDLLNIGIGYGTTGLTRQNASNNWLPQSCQNWGKTTTVGAIDYKHLDTNGDGVIEASDKDAIVSNYGKSHAKNGVQMGSRAGNPPLYFKFSKDTFYRGENVTAGLYVGNSSNKINGVYGVALNYGYYYNFMQAGSYSMTYNCDFFCNQSSLNIIHDNMPFMESSVVNTDHIGINGYGKIADINYWLSKDSSLYPYIQDTIRLSFYNALVIDKDGNAITVDPQPAQAIVKRDGHSGIASQLPYLSALSVYPNPFNHEFNLSISLNKAARVRITCVDVLGREIGQLLDKNVDAISNNFNFKDEQAGIAKQGVYFIKIQVDGQINVIRLIKI